MTHYKQLTYEQRCQIYVLKKSNKSQTAIAAMIGTTQPTISRELKRNTGKRGYRYKQAQERSNIRRHEAAKAIKMTPDMIDFIESKLREKWSPEQISGWLWSMQSEKLSHETIYKHIWANKTAGGGLYHHLHRQGKAYQSRAKSQAGQGHIKDRIGIEERPEVVDNKSRIGDWEIDLVIGKEFAYHKKMTKALHADVFFADPYCSWQRGLNENTNGLLRQYWPKSTDFKTVPIDEVMTTVNQLNNRPRKKLHYRTPASLMAKHMAAIAA